LSAGWLFAVRVRRSGRETSLGPSLARGEADRLLAVTRHRGSRAGRWRSRLVFSRVRKRGDGRLIRENRGKPPNRSAPEGTGVDGNRTHQVPREWHLNGFEGRGTHQASGHSPEWTPQLYRVLRPPPPPPNGLSLSRASEKFVVARRHVVAQDRSLGVETVQVRSGPFAVLTSTAEGQDFRRQSEQGR